MIKCIAVDDETLALDLIEDNIKQVPFLQLVKRCKNAFEAKEVLENDEIDLLFLDIQMPGITGIQFLETLNKKPMVIFITAYKKYAFESFELDVLDYLLKPVSLDRFKKAAVKAQEYYYLQKNFKKENKILPDYFFVNADHMLVKVMVNDIKYIEGLKDYIKIYTVNSPKPIITRLTMKGVEERLPAEKFIRVHKSYIVSTDKIMSLKKNRLNLQTIEIPVSDFYKAGLQKFISQNNFK